MIINSSEVGTLINFPSANIATPSLGLTLHVSHIVAKFTALIGRTYFFICAGITYQYGRIKWETSVSVHLAHSFLTISLLFSFKKIFRYNISRYQAYVIYTVKEVFGI
jgi:hypothetical protein